MHGIWYQSAQSVKSKQYAHKETKTPLSYSESPSFYFRTGPNAGSFHTGGNSKA